MTQSLEVLMLGSARRYRIARDSAGLTQRDLAAALGIAPTTLSDWETGKTDPSFPNMVRLAKLTGQELEWFAEGVEVDMRARRDSNPQPSDWEPDAFWTVDRTVVWLEIYCQDYLDAESTHSGGWV